VSQKKGQRFAGIQETSGMEKVTGIGGLFFRARDPKALAEWYSKYLGVDVVPSSYDQLPWQQQAGPTAFAPFPEDTDYFGSYEKQWMINFRVANLDEIVAQLKSAGIPAEVDPQIYPNGRFARIHDLEGNAVELWEPAGRDAFHS
jgi:glyoxylase I family protein